jgi:hypothetical protein
MLRRVGSLTSLAETDLLTADECDEVANSVLDLRDCWRVRSPGGRFFTLGVNAYMDLAHAADWESSYFAPVQSANEILRSNFDGLYDRLLKVLGDDVGLPARFTDDLALPGFHIWTGAGIPHRSGASTHFDLQYQRILMRDRYKGASGTISFTLPIRLPAAGSCLLVWPDFQYPTGLSHLASSKQIDPEVVDYRLGSAIVHTGHILHQIGPTSSVEPEDVRITLQGHGLVVDDSLLLYW